MHHQEDREMPDEKNESNADDQEQTRAAGEQAESRLPRPGIKLRGGPEDGVDGKTFEEQCDAMFDPLPPLPRPRPQRTVFHDIRDSLRDIQDKLTDHSAGVAGAAPGRGDDAPDAHSSTDASDPSRPATTEAEDAAPPRRLSTVEAAKQLRVRKARFTEIANREMNAGREVPCERVGGGGKRVHLRWDEARLADWWATVT